MLMETNQCYLRKNCYSMSIIKKTLPQLKSVKHFIQINMCEFFYQRKMIQDLKEFIIFLIRFSIFQYLAILFDFGSNLAFF